MVLAGTCQVAYASLWVVTALEFRASHTSTLAVARVPPNLRVSADAQVELFSRRSPGTAPGSTRLTGHWRPRRTGVDPGGRHDGIGRVEDGGDFRARLTLQGRGQLHFCLGNRAIGN